MAIVEITIRERVASMSEACCLVCNNPTDIIRFNFDEEWYEHAVKTARFAWEGKYIDVPFSGNEVEAPEIYRTNYVYIGVYTDNLTSSHVKVPCRYSIKCLGGNTPPPSPDVYEDIIRLINSGSGGGTGANGYSPTVKVTEIEGGHRITITDIKGKSTIDVMDGIDGAAGSSVTVKSVSTSTEDGGSNVVTFSDGKTLTVKNGSKGSPGADGSNGVDGRTPVRGSDYWTAADQEAIVQEVIAALGTPVFGRVDAENNIILTGELAEGTYVIKYEDAEGNRTTIGTLTAVGVPTYTNILKLPEIGYQLNREISTSNYEERDSSGGYDLTGYIPIKKEDVIYLKNVTMPDNVTDRSNTIYYYDGDKAWAGSFNCTSNSSFNWEPVFENGNLVRCTSKTNGYIRINAQDINETSVITINEPIE